MAQVPATRTGQGGRLAAREENPLQRLQQNFDTLFGRLMGGWLAPFDQDIGSLRVWDFDINENDQEIVVRAELPGFEPNELDVQINNGALTIKAEKEKKANGHEEYRSFLRTVALPSGISADQAQATYRNGVLELHIPRAEGNKPKHISVQGEQPGQTEQRSGRQTATTASQQTKR